MRARTDRRVVEGGDETGVRSVRAAGATVVFLASRAPVRPRAVRPRLVLSRAFPERVRDVARDGAGGEAPPGRPTGAQRLRRRVRRRRRRHSRRRRRRLVVVGPNPPHPRPPPPPRTRPPRAGRPPSPPPPPRAPRARTRRGAWARGARARRATRTPRRSTGSSDRSPRFSPPRTTREAIPPRRRTPRRTATTETETRRDRDRRARRDFRRGKTPRAPCGSPARRPS
jgi:hypothetical protein